MNISRSTDITRPTIRRATQNDGNLIFGLVEALAHYEKLTPPDEEARRRFLADMSGDRPRIEVFLAEVGGKAVGYTIILETYSSFLARPTLYLEDFFVLPEFRNRKIGYALFRAMVNEAHNRGCGRMEWAVLDWNKLAIDFYERLGARHLKEWNYYRLLRDDMEHILDFKS